MGYAYIVVAYIVYVSILQVFLVSTIVRVVERWPKIVQKIAGL